jgi:hypothetical protein
MDGSMGFWKPLAGMGEGFRRTHPSSVCALNEARQVVEGFANPMPCDAGPVGIFARTKYE